LSFCISCGSKNSEGVKFCSSCGKPVQDVAPATEVKVETPVSVENVAKPKLDLLKNKVVIFGGGGVLAAILAVVLVIALTPFSLDAKTAESRLMTVSDFAFDAVEDDKPVTAEGSAYPIYRASDKCDEDVEMQALINDEGTLLASSDFKENSTEVTSVHFDQDVIKFEDDATATKFVGLAKAGYDNSDCEYNSTGESVSVEGILSGAADVQSALGVGGSNSFYVRYQSEMTVSGYFNFTISSDSRIAVIARGPYVLIFRGTLDAETKSVSGDEMETSLKTAISKMLG
jgi:hypothetical protein